MFRNLFKNKVEAPKLEPWQQKIQDWKVEQARLENIKREEEEKRQDQLRKASRKAFEDKVTQQIGDKFQCHVCGKRASKPGQKMGSNGNDMNGEERGWVDDYDKPGDLFECSICHQWTCPDHIHSEVCKTCAEKL